MKTPPVQAVWSQLPSSRSQVVERPGEVVARVDHEPVAEAVDALVEGERRAAAQAGVGADATRRLRELVLLDVHERALDRAVVVARPASGRARGEGLPDLAVEMGERGGPDGMGDAVAVALDRAQLCDLPLEALERLPRPLVVGEVAVALLEAGEVVAAAFERRVVGLEVAGQRAPLRGRRRSTRPRRPRRRASPLGRAAGGTTASRGHRSPPGGRPARTPAGACRDSARCRRTSLRRASAWQPSQPASAKIWAPACVSPGRLSFEASSPPPQAASARAVAASGPSLRRRLIMAPSVAPSREPTGASVR